MSLKILIELERWKLFRKNLRDSAFLGLSVASISLLLYLSFAESIAQSPMWHQLDKWLHFTLFGCFTLTFLLYARSNFLIRIDFLPRIICFFLILIPIGILAEVLHLFIPHRTFDLKDMVANISGIFIFGIPCVCLVPFKKIETFNQECFSADSVSTGWQVLRIRKRMKKN